ncbi:uncharacterized protein I303_107735 [Kwoniella dejecticola CBS 10117]|uniref:Uncharacterized protein n=1 Tax=Kwoniella dejecticola CBS 10117 TaxID=1296121 RepID=A0A1A5ZVJ5_9TREE|nr:uncharacterized protein I303_07740 [Kwoniella dejecticola CBS 10117]OBR81830.1 hypothetical protein I303_07740 [Kwoniella dejecticola CBS 10117]
MCRELRTSLFPDTEQIADLLDPSTAAGPKARTLILDIRRTEWQRAANDEGHAKTDDGETSSQSSMSRPRRPSMHGRQDSTQSNYNITSEEEYANTTRDIEGEQSRQSERKKRVVALIALSAMLSENAESLARESRQWSDLLEGAKAF